MNKKGFALTETLVVVVFLVTIFTFVYVSIIPLIGEYENMLDVEKDIDNIYKLSRIRSIIMSDANRNEVTSLPVNKIECSDLGYATFCEKVLEQLELITDEEDNYVVIYAESLSDDNLDVIETINAEIASYARKNSSKITERVLFLLDTRKHTISYLYYDDMI